MQYRAKFPVHFPVPTLVQDWCWYRIDGMLFTFPMHGTHGMSGGFPACRAGQVAMYTPTILHVSCMVKIDNIHEQWH